MLVSLLTLVTIAGAAEPVHAGVEVLVPGTPVTDRIGFFDIERRDSFAGNCTAQLVGTFQDDKSFAIYDISFTRSTPETDAATVKFFGLEPLTAKTTVRGEVARAQTPAHYYGVLGEVLILTGSVAVDITIDGVKQPTFTLKPSLSYTGFCDFELAGNQ